MPSAGLNFQRILAFNPRQRCGHSNLLFARTYYFYSAGSGNGLEGVGRGGYAHTQKKLTLSKASSLLYSRNICEGRQLGSKTTPGSCESVMRRTDPVDPVEEEFQLILFKLSH